MTLRPNRRAAIYARFSTDLQNDRSVEDQIALCTQYAERTSARVVARYADRARSGASILGRDGLIDLMEDARNDGFDVVIVEALDRLSRDQEDLAGLYKRLKFAGVDIEAVHDGVADPVQIGVRGMLGSLYLADLTHKVRRGLTGVVNDGRTAGGRSYGYRPVLGKPGELEIVPEEAEVVRRIFREYVAGRTPRQIAVDLNRERVPAPRGNTWTASTINGNAARGYGLLINPLYVGEIVWNRVRMVRNPDTGKRVNRVNPREQWIVSKRPELAILDRETWDAAQRRKKSRSHQGGGWKSAPPRRLLSGLTRCGACGGGMVVRGRDRIGTRVGCSRAREAGACDHRRTVYLHKIEAVVVNHLLSAISKPELMREYLQAYHEEMNKLTAKVRRDETKLRRQLGAAERKIDRLLDLVADPDAPMERIKTQLREAEEERRRIERELELCREAVPVVTLHPEAADRWRADLEYLRDSLPTVSAEDEVAKRVRELVDSVAVLPGESRDPVEIEITGRLPALIGEGEKSAVRMVAGEGLEPSTSGL